MSMQVGPVTLPAERYDFCFACTAPKGWPGLIEHIYWHCASWRVLDSSAFWYLKEASDVAS